MRLGTIRTQWGTVDDDELRAARELRQARVRAARAYAGWQEISEVRKAGPLFATPDGTLVSRWDGLAFHKASILKTPELRFIVGDGDTITFYEVVRRP